MPEGDTVWLAGRTLDQALAGQLLVRSDFRVPELATLDLSGRTVGKVESYGKHLFFHFDRHAILHTHFRMDGSWHLYSLGQRWRGGPGWQIRAIMSTATVTAVGYRLPVIDMFTGADRERLISTLGPDLIREDVDFTAAARRCLSGEASRPVGETLLDQRVVAGLGLIYVTETLFLHGITPWVHVDQVPDLAAVLGTASRLMRANRHHYIQTTTGDTARDAWHWVYERAGRGCRRCGATIEIAWQASAAHRRLAYWCPRCQSGPAPLGLSPEERRRLRTQGRSRYRP
jgi:endonuclease-8